VTGSRRYYAFDVVRAATGGWNLPMLDELVDLLKSRTPIPDQNEFPEVKPGLDSYEFPVAVLPNDRLAEATAPERVAAIRHALLNLETNGPVEIGYRVPWIDSGVIQAEMADLVVSQAVLEHVDDLETCYRAMADWLKPGGYSSHQIDFTSHKLAHEWNGHWGCSRTIWGLVRTGLPYLLNRAPCSVHRELLVKNGLQQIISIPKIRTDGLKRNQIRREFRHFTDDDLITAGTYLLSRKRLAATTRL
jgi:hypothetical protein